MDSKKIAVLSASIGGFDSPKVHTDQDIDCTFTHFDTLPYPLHDQTNRLKAKVPKMLSHRLTDAGIIVWIDGNVKIKSASFIRDMVEQLGDADICIANHPFRSSVYEEADFIEAEINKGNKYLKQRYDASVIQQELTVCGPVLTGLYYCGIFARKNNPKVNVFFEQWFLHNVLYSTFDQNSFVKLVQQYGIKLSVIDFGDFYDNKNYCLVNHSK